MSTFLGTGNGFNVPDDCRHIDNAPWDDEDGEESLGEFSGKAIMSVKEWDFFVAYDYSGWLEPSDNKKGYDFEFNPPKITRIFSGDNHKLSEAEAAEYIAGGLQDRFKDLAVPDGCQFYGYLMDMVNEHALDHVLEHGWDKDTISSNDDPEAM